MTHPTPDQLTGGLPTVSSVQPGKPSMPNAEAAAAVDFGTAPVAEQASPTPTGGISMGSGANPAAIQFQPTGSSTPLYFDCLEMHPTAGYQELLYAQQIDDTLILECECKPFLRGARRTLSNMVTNPGFEAPSGPGVTVFNDTLANFNAYTLAQNAWVPEVLPDKPLRFYRLGEPSGTTAVDSAGSGNAGTYVGSPTLGVAGPPGTAGWGSRSMALRNTSRSRPLACRPATARCRC